MKEFRLTAEPVKREFAKGLVVNAWGYNGSTPGPTIEAVDGDRVRFYVTNKLPERTSVHWHGILLPKRLSRGRERTGGGRAWACPYYDSLPMAFVAITGPAEDLHSCPRR